MLKGKTKIILTNVETGEQEIHEDENLVTNALDKLINIEMAMNHAPNTRILPIATNALGGIMLFDEELTEDPDNIHFPVESHLVGYAYRSTNTTDVFRGSYNSVESGKTADGYVSVWDFGTSQANGTIKAVARTHNHGAACPMYNYLGPEAVSTSSGNPTTDTYWYPIRYDGTYLYMLKGNTSNHEMRMARVKIPRMGMGVADYSGVARTYELVASWNTELTTYEYYSNSSHTQTSTVTVYADDPRMYEDGQDGFIYCVAYHPVSHTYGNIYDYTVTYFKIKYGDESYEKSDTIRIPTGGVPNGRQGTSSNGMYWAYRLYGHVHNGILYMLNSQASKLISIVPLDNVGAYRSIRILDSESPDYVYNLCYICGHNGAIYFQVYHYTTSSYNYLNGILYPDGVFIVTNVSYGGDDPEHDASTLYRSYCWTSDADLTVWGYYSDTSVVCNWAANYLGTINNLGTTITKTAAQTMKIVYTLTDVDEEEESEGE